MITTETKPITKKVRLQLTLRGVVQGVGFRPFVYRLATELGLAGRIKNSPQGVGIEVEGPRAVLERFSRRVIAEKPPHSCIQSCETAWLAPVGFPDFQIHESTTTGAKTALVPPDLATCADCRREILDPTNRRYHYPFTNCTNCGPRFSLIEALPYDRAHTSMKSFLMCPACALEYNDPRDRRFHAQPNACPVCGPQLELWLGDTTPAAVGSPPRRLAAGYAALLAAANGIRCGQIVAMKGIGGFHLLVDARNDVAVRRLRERKHRAEKPFALMFPSLESLKEICTVSPLEERLLCSPEAPIVLLSKVATCPHPGPLPKAKGSHSGVVGTFAHTSFIVSSPTMSIAVAPARSEQDFPEPAEFASLPTNRSAPGLRSPSPLLRKERRGAGETWPGSGEQSGSSDGSWNRSPEASARARASERPTRWELAASVAPGNPNLGAMLPSNPLHHLLMAELGFPIVATSGNLSEEPICTDEFEARDRLRDLADVFLVHDRPIVRPMDDSVVRVMLERAMMLRRARGYAPLPIPVRSAKPGTRPLLAVGAHLKNSVALAVGDQVFISQHIGDLDTEPANRAFRRVVADLPRLYGAPPEVIVTDLHPDYRSTKYADELTGPAGHPVPAIHGAPGCARPTQIGVQHHVAHVLSCIAEHEVALPVLGVAWDGTGYGPDGNIWGGEFFRVTTEGVERVAHLRPFRLPGGDAAVKEPRRAAFGLLFEVCGERVIDCKGLAPVAAFSNPELAVLRNMVVRGVNAPWCSSVGRLFDAVASLVGVRQKKQFEGQAAMALEFALPDIKTDESYYFPLVVRGGTRVLDWLPMIEAMIVDGKRGLPVGEISARFHNTLAEAIVQVARGIDCPRVALSGGCFQNRYLTERAVSRLHAAGFQAYWHQAVPTNDGGIALGQVFAARHGLTLRN